jgi:uncharacterized protein (DUF58 family)
LALESEGLYPGTGMGARLRLTFPGLLPPGVVGAYLYKTETREGARFSWQADIIRGRNDIEISLSAPRRGAYSGPPGFILLRDCFGFARTEIPFPGEEKLLVYPEVYDRDLSLGARSEGGEKTLRNADRKRSDEFLEIRRYIPGDDVRRINWKLFAHAEDLMLRLGEEEPPPESVTLLLLDPRIDPGTVPAVLIPGMTDRMASLAARLVLSLSGRGRRVVLSVPETPTPLPVEPGRPGPALSLLAGLGPRRDMAPPRLEEIPGRGRLNRIIVLAFPGGPGPRDIVKNAAGPDAKILLGLVGPGEEEPAEERPLRDLVFLPPPGRARTERARRAGLRAVNRRLREDKAEFESGPWRAEHVEIL